jgi:hypothetical protein
MPKIQHRHYMKNQKQYCQQGNMLRGKVQKRKTSNLFAIHRIIISSTHLRQVTHCITSIIQIIHCFYAKNTCFYGHFCTRHQYRYLTSLEYRFFTFLGVGSCCICFFPSSINKMMRISPTYSRKKYRVFTFHLMPSHTSHLIQI